MFKRNKIKEKNKRKKLVINMNEWAPFQVFSQVDHRSYLHSPTTNRYCCLGLCLRDIYGISKEELTNQHFPHSVMKIRYIPEASWCYIKIGKELYKSDLAQSFIDANDNEFKNTRITLEERKEMITKLFDEINIDVEFVGEIDEEDLKIKRQEYLDKER